MLQVWERSFYHVVIIYCPMNRVPSDSVGAGHKSSYKIPASTHQSYLW